MKQKFLLLGLCAALFFWVVESVFHAFLFHQGPLLQQLLRPAPHERWMRALVAVLFLALSFSMEIMLQKRRKVEKALRESEERHRNFVESAPESIVVIDREGRVCSCNLATEELTGYRKEELEGKRLNELKTLNPEDLPRVGATLEFLVKGGSFETFELESVRKDGKRIWVGVKTRALFSGNEIEGIQVISRDLTERKRMEEALRESEEKYRMLFHASPESVTLVGLDGTILDCNEATSRLTGLPREQMVGRSFTELASLDNDRMPEYVAMFSRALHGDKVQSFEHRILSGNGEPRWNEVYPAFVKRGDDISAILVITRDVTERKKSEEALRASEKKVAATLDAVPDLVYELAVDGTVMYANQSALEKLGVSLDHLGKINMTDLLAPPNLEKAIRDVQSILETGQSARNLRYDLRTADGRTVPVEANSILLERTDHSPTILGIARDVTERERIDQELQKHREQLEELVEQRTLALKMTNEQLQKEVMERKEAEREIRMLNERLEERVQERTRELQRAYEELMELDKIKDSFLSSVSHEFRTPLTSIRSFAEILLQYENEDPATRRDFLDIIHRESERLTRLINDFLDLSKIEAGQMVYNEDLCHVDEIIRDVTQSQNQLLQEKCLRLEIEIQGKLPHVFVDRDRIHQVITNLLNNAVKFSHRGTEIRIRAEQFTSKRSGDPSEWIRVSVSDQGVGIDEADFKNIFDKFRQVSSDTLKDKPMGTGLGLPISREIIGHYGGNVWVESQVGKGSTFFFTLPVASVLSAGPRKEASETPDRRNGLGKTILIMDENPKVRRLLGSQLLNRGYDILEASDLEELLGQIQERSVDLIILNIVMPLMNGYDTLGIIREDLRTKNVPVLVVSMLEDKERGILLGANAFLKKPFKELELVESLRALLDEGENSILVVDDEMGVREMLRLQLEDKGYRVDVARDGQEALDSIKEQVPNLVILDVCMPKKSGMEVLTWIRCHAQTQSLPVIILTGQKLSDEKTKLFSLGGRAQMDRTKGLSSLFEVVDATMAGADRPPYGTAPTPMGDHVEGLGAEPSETETRH